MNCFQNNVEEGEALPNNNQVQKKTWLLLNDGGYYIKTMMLYL